MNRNVLVTLLVALLVIATVVVHAILLGGAPLVRLHTAPPLAGAISQSLATSSFGKSQPVLNKDYTIKDTHYFENQTWAVVKVSSVGENANNATLVLEKIAGTYQIILGPGTAFSVDNTQNIPIDVIQYVKSQGVVIYVPSNGQ